MPTFDLRPATDAVSDLLGGIDDRQLSAPSPCPDYSVGGLLDHFMALSGAFTVAATKGDPSTLAGESRPGEANADHLSPDWRAVLPPRLDGLAMTWATPSAWQGTTDAGGVMLPADVAALVALDEVVVHGWDLARATGQDYEVAPALLDVLHGFVAGAAEPTQAEMRANIFGPAVNVPDDASLWERTLGLAGRDPNWTPPTAATT